MQLYQANGLIIQWS